MSIERDIILDLPGLLKQAGGGPLAGETSNPEVLQQRKRFKEWQAQQEDTWNRGEDERELLHDADWEEQKRFDSAAWLRRFRATKFNAINHNSHVPGIIPETPRPWHEQLLEAAASKNNWPIFDSVRAAQEARAYRKNSKNKADLLNRRDSGSGPEFQGVTPPHGFYDPPEPAVTMPRKFYRTPPPEFNEKPQKNASADPIDRAIKQARPLDDLLAAKKESDRRNYPAKHDILRKLIKQSPGDFMIDSEEGSIYGVTHIPTGFQIHMPRSEAPSELQKMPTQDDIFEKVRKYLPADAQHASGGMPDVNGVSDVDVSVYHPDPVKALELLPKGTTVRSQKDNAVEYAVPGYRRDVNVYVTSDPDVAQQSVDHRRTTRALKDKFPDAYQVAEALKRQGLGTEPAWAQALDVKGDPYKAMRDTDAMLAAGDDDVYVQSAIPSSALAMVRKHGLLSSEALLSNPEALAALVAAHKGNPTAVQAKGKRGITDEKVFRKRVEDNLKDKFWADAMKGPSVFFGEPDPDKITDIHPTRRFPHQTVRVNLSKILRDQPKTRISGTELQPWDDEGPEAQGHLRHYDIDLAKVREYAATDPKELWKHYNSPEGTHYASDVPHAQIITPSGSIAPEYLDFGDAPKPVLKQAGRTIKDLDLSEYLKGYELNDPGHGPQHAENVRRTAAGLSGIHAPGREHLVDYAAALHDMDVHGGREDHENRAADTIANAPYFQENLSKRDLRTVSEAVRQHRSSTGRPRTTVAKIVSDADRLAEIDPAAALQRAVSWGQQHDPALTEDEQILRAYAHLVEKYGPGGKARRLYYPESLPQLEEKINPIISTEGDIDKLKALLQVKQAKDKDADLQELRADADRTAFSRPTVRFILPYEDQYLLQMAQDPKWKGLMRHAGGGVEEGETPQEAALREFEEEFGQKLQPEQFKYLGRDPRKEFASHHFYEVLNHGLSPNTYQASNDPDEIVHLVKAMQTGDKYLGPDMKQVFGWSGNPAKVTHISGASGSGKSTILADLREKYPELVTMDVDELSNRAEEALEDEGDAPANWGEVQHGRVQWTDEQLLKFYARKQQALDQLLEDNQDKNVVLAGLHSAGSSWGNPEGASLNFPEGTDKLLVNTGALRSAWRGHKRDNTIWGDEGNKYNRRIRDFPFHYRTAKSDIKSLKSLGYTPQSQDEIVESFDKQSLDREIILDLPGLLKKAYLQGAPLAPTGNNTLSMLTANTPVEPYAQNFSSVGEYADELPGALITRPSEGPLWKGDIGSTVKSVLTRPLERREEANRHARSFRMIQAAIAKREGIDSRNQAWSTAMQNQPTTTTDSPWGEQQTGPVGAPQRPQAQGQGAAWDGRTGWFYDLMSRNPDEFELNSSTGNESTWVHKPTGMQYTVPDAPSPSTRFSVHTEQPNFDEWANAMRWRQGKPARG